MASGLEDRFLRKLEEQPPAVASKPQAKRSSRPKAALQATRLRLWLRRGRERSLSEALLKLFLRRKCG